MTEIDINEKIEEIQELQRENNKEIFAMDLDRLGIQTLRGVSKTKLEKGRAELKKGKKG